MESERGVRPLNGRRRWLRVAAAAEMLEVSEHTLRRWADAGVVPCRRTPSGQRRFLAGDLERFLEGSEHGSDGDALPRVSRAVAREQDPRAALALVARTLADALAVPCCLVMEHDDALDALVCVAGASAQPEDPGAACGVIEHEGEVWPLADRPAEREMLRSGEPLREGSRLCVPFGLGGESNGCLALLGPRAGRLPAAGLGLARDVGDLAALAVNRVQAERARAEQSARMDSLLHAGQSMTSSLVLQDVLDSVAREVVDTFDAHYCVIWEYVEDRDMLVERAGFGVDDDYSVDDDFILLDERPKEREILFSPVPVVETVSDPLLDAESRESMERWGEKTCLSLPLRFGGATLGVLVVCETERERRFSEEEMELARGLANQASAAVHNARVYRDLEERNVELVARARRERLLNELSLELGASLDPRKVLDSACSRICTILDATGCEIWAHHDDGTIECLAAWVAGEAVEEWIGRRLPLADWAVTRMALEEGETLVVTSLDDPRLGDEERAVMREWDQRSAIATPLRARGRILGTLEVTQAGRERDFTPEEVATAEACARLTAPAIDNATLYEGQADHARRLQSLLEAGRAVTSSLVIEDVLAALVHTAATSLGISGGADLRVRRRGRRHDDALRVPGEPDGLPGHRQAVSAQRVPLGQAAAGERRCRRRDDLRPGPAPDVRESMERHGEKTCLTVPLRFGATGWAC